MKFEEFKRQIEDAYHGKFGASWCRCSLTRCLGLSIDIRMMLAENLEECRHGIGRNDAVHALFMIHLPDNFQPGDDLPENLVLKALENSLTVKPVESWLYCSGRKIPFRKTTGNAQKLIASFGKFADRLHAAIVEEYSNNNLLDFDMELVRCKRYAG